MTVPRADNSAKERSVIALLELLAFTRENRANYPDLEFEGFCETFDIAMDILEKKDPALSKRLDLDKAKRAVFLQVCLLQHSNVVRLGKWHGRTIIRLHTSAGQTIRQMLRNFENIGWKSEVEHACEEARMLYREPFDSAREG